MLILFYLFAIAAVASALFTVLNPRPVSSAMSLVLTMFSLAGIYVLLDAQLVAALQVIVYAGAIMVLILFVVMLLNATEKDAHTNVKRLLAQVALLAFIGFVFLGMACKFAPDAARTTASHFPVDYGTVKGVGRLLFNEYVLPFEAVSLILLSAVTGAIILARRKL